MSPGDERRRNGAVAYSIARWFSVVFGVMWVGMLVWLLCAALRSLDVSLPLALTVLTGAFSLPLVAVYVCLRGTHR